MYGIVRPCLVLVVNFPHFPDLAQFEGLENIETYILGLVSGIIILVIAVILLICAISIVMYKSRRNKALLLTSPPTSQTLVS